MKYRPDIDGLRAIAILFVICFHSGLRLFPSGFIGVDIFFVISGYLITTIIHTALQNNNFSFIEFYNRRLLIIIDPRKVQCLKGRCKVTINDVPIFRDTVHLSDYASSKLAELYLQRYQNPLIIY